MSKSDKMKKIRQELLVPPEDEMLVCPNCGKLDNYVEKEEDKYPLIRCNICQISFFSMQFRSSCTKWHMAVTKKQCQECFLFKKAEQCAFWNGVLPPPMDLARALMQKGTINSNSHPASSFARKVA